MSRNTFPFTKSHKGGSVKWLDLTVGQRGLMQLLWSIGEPDPTGAESVVETAGTDTASHLTMRLNIRRDRDRKSTTRSIRDLVKAGFIDPCAGRARILSESRFASTQPTDSRQTASTQPTDSQTHSRRTANIQPDIQTGASAGNVCEPPAPKPLLDQKEETEKKERAAREHARAQDDQRGDRGFIPRRPGHPMHSDPPPEARLPARPTPREPTLEERVIRAHRRAVGDKMGREPGETVSTRIGAAKTVEWLLANVREDEEPLAVFQAALKLYLEDPAPSLWNNAYPLGWIVDRLPSLTATKEQSVVKPPKPVRPTNAYDEFYAQANELMVPDPDKSYGVIPLRVLKERRAAALAAGKVANA